MSDTSEYDEQSLIIKAKDIEQVTKTTHSDEDGVQEEEGGGKTNVVWRKMIQRLVIIHHQQ